MWLPTCALQSPLHPLHGAPWHPLRSVILRLSAFCLSFLRLPPLLPLTLQWHGDHIISLRNTMQLNAGQGSTEGRPTLLPVYLCVWVCIQSSDESWTEHSASNGVLKGYFKLCHGYLNAPRMMKMMEAVLIVETRTNKWIMSTTGFWTLQRMIVSPNGRSIVPYNHLPWFTS